MLPSRSALTLLCPVLIPSTSLLLAGDLLSPTLLFLPHRGLDFKHQSKLLQSPIMLNPLCNPCHIFRDIHHGLKWPVFCLSQHLSSPFGPFGESHDHVLDVLGRISTLASWIIYSWNFFSVQIGIEPNVLTSYLHSYATLGPVRVFMDTDRCSSVVHSCLSGLFVSENVGCNQILESAAAWWLVDCLVVSLFQYFSIP